MEFYWEGDDKRRIAFAREPPDDTIHGITYTTLSLLPEEPVSAEIAIIMPQSGSSGKGGEEDDDGKGGGGGTYLRWR